MYLLDGHSTDELVAKHKAARPDLSPAQLDEVIPVAIDTLYAARDKGLNMHAAGAAVAVAVLAALKI